MSFQKTPAYKSQKYIDFVKSLDCCITNTPNPDPHHITGKKLSGTGKKASDLFAFPLANVLHTGNLGIHRQGVNEWENEYGKQWKYVRRTIKTAISKGIITREFAIEEIENQVTNLDDKQFLLEGI